MPTDLRFRTAKCARRYVNLFEKWTDWWTPGAPYRMVSTIAAFIITLTYSLREVVQIVSNGMGLSDSYFYKIGTITLVAFSIVFALKLWWSNARDAKRLDRVNSALGGNYKDLDAARIGAIGDIFFRKPEEFYALANELHKIIGMHYQYGPRQSSIFKRALHGIFDPAGKQRVVALFIALIALFGAALVRLEGASEGLFSILSFGVNKIIIIDFVISLYILIMLEFAAWVGRQLELVAENIDQSANVGDVPAIRYVVRDLLILGGSSVPSPSTEREE